MIRVKSIASSIANPVDSPCGGIYNSGISFSVPESQDYQGFLRHELHLQATRPCPSTTLHLEAIYTRDTRTSHPLDQPLSRACLPMDQSDRIAPESRSSLLLDRCL